MAARIDARMKQLEALELLEVEILSQMADFMPDFHHLMLKHPARRWTPCVRNFPDSTGLPKS